MEGNTISDTLRTIITTSGTETKYSKLGDSAKRQVAVATVLELYKADALGGQCSIYSNLGTLEQHVTEILKAMDPNDQ